MDNNDKLMRFMQSQKAARELIRRDINGGLNEAKRSAIASGKLSYGDEGLPVSSINETVQTPQASHTPINFNSPAAKKLPKAILESMKANPLDESHLTPSVSILDELNKSTNGKLFEGTQNSVETQNQPTSSANNSTIDYSMIRMICEETMRKYMGSLKKSILNESKNHNSDTSNTLKAMKIGNKFSFITNDGNIYEAKLVLKGNVNDK